jgi:hypothetical protein
VALGSEAQVQHSSTQLEQLAFARAVATALNRLDEEAWAHATMGEIRQRHEIGCSTTEEHRTYRACWRTIALRRSFARRAFLPPEVEQVLARRARLMAEIENEQARQAVEAAFLSPPEGETSAADPAPASL